MTETYTNVTRLGAARSFVSNYLDKLFPGVTHAHLNAVALSDPTWGSPWPDTLETDARLYEIFAKNTNLSTGDRPMPACEVRNRVYQVVHVSICLDFDLIFAARDQLNHMETPVNSLQYRDNCLKTVLNTGDRCIRAWVTPAKKYNGGLLIDWNSPFLNYRRSHAKMYSRSPCLQLHCQLTQAEAYAAYRSLQSVILKLDNGQHTAEFATCRDILPQDFRCILENNRIDLYRQIKDVVALTDLLEADRKALAGFHDTLFTCISGISRGNARVIIKFKTADGYSSTLTLCSTGRGFMSSNHVIARLLAYTALLQLLDLYSDFFEPRPPMTKQTDSHSPTRSTPAPSSSSSRRPSSSEALTSSLQPARKRSRPRKLAEIRPSTPAEAASSEVTETTGSSPSAACCDPDASSADAPRAHSAPARGGGD